MVVITGLDQISGNGMANLTEDQQNFWNLLRWPYEKNCRNCKWDGPRCNHPDRRVNTDYDGCNAMGRGDIGMNGSPYQNFWEWDGRIK